MNKQHKWTAADLDYISQNYLTQSNAEMAEHLGVSKSSVERRLRKLSLQRHHNWDEADHDYICQNYLTKDYDQLAEHLGIGKDGVKYQLRKLSLRRRRPAQYLSDGSNIRKDPLYGSYHTMLNRCYNPKNKYFLLYGGKSQSKKGEKDIVVGNEWLGEYGFERYRDFSLDAGWEPGDHHHRLYEYSDYCERHVIILTKEQHILVHNTFSNDEVWQILEKRHILNMNIQDISAQHPQSSYGNICSICHGHRYPKVFYKFEQYCEMIGVSLNIKRRIKK